MGQKHSVPLSVDSKPSKKKLVELIPHVAPHWYLIGIQLLREDQESLLDVIKADYGHDKVQSCTEMFCLWLKSHPNASWRQLIESLRSPAVQLHSVAADIETMLTDADKASKILFNFFVNYKCVLLGKPNATTASKMQGEVPQPDFYKFKNVSLAFVSLTSSVTKHLENQDFFILRRACIAQIDSPDGAKLPEDVVNDIKSAENLKTLLDILTATKYWNWIDLRLLEALVVASGSSTAQDIVDKYKAAVYSKKLIEILQNAPSKEIRDAYFTKIVSKVNKNPEEVTVADLIEFRSKLETVIMEINKGTCAVGHISNGSIEIHWYIPTHHIDHAYKAACLQRRKFHELHLVHLQIGNKPVIYASQIVHSSQSVLLKPSPPVNADTSKDVIDHFYHYLSIGLDTDLIVQSLVTQHLLNDGEVDNLKNATSRYQKNCLLLEKIRLMDMKKLESFCKLLQSFDSQRHIGNVIIDAFQLFGFSRIEPLPEPSRDQDLLASIGSKNSQTNSVSSGSNGKSSVSRKRRLSSEQHAGVKYFKPSSVTAEFLNVRKQLEDILQGCDAQKMLVECRGLMASEAHNIHLVSDEEYLQSLNECKFAPEILQKLSPLFTWSDHSVLTAVVKACDNAEANSLLQQFDSHVDLSLPITEYPVPQPIPNMAPYDTSTQTVLAVKVNAELSKFSFEQVVELRRLIQKNFDITGHSLQLLAAKSSSTILYWIIPKCIGHLINSKIMQDHTLHASRVEEISVYPGTLFVSASNLNVGSLSFLSQINDTLTQDEHEVLSTQLSHLEQLPNVISMLQLELIKKESVQKSEVQKYNVLVQTEIDDQFDQSKFISDETSEPSSSHDLKAILKHVNSQNVE